MGSLGGPSFSAPTEVISAEGLLFDFDGQQNPLDPTTKGLNRDTGTIIDSTDAIVKHWHELGKTLGVDPNVILQTSHGRRSIDVLQLYDPSKANEECESKQATSMPFSNM